MTLKIGAKIRQLRKRGDITQEKLAEALGVTSQAISRWESENGYPDIEYVAPIANYFGVTTDYLFDNDKNQKHGGRVMSKDDWNTMAEYLKKSREVTWNNDYMQFLVDKVWRIDRPVNLVDFGCGRGFIAAAFLPLLPEGSTYTGIDMAEVLLQEAAEMFMNSPYDIAFIEEDLLEYQPVAKYDIAICHAVLQHIPDSKAVLKKMRDSVVPGGKVICFESDRNIGNASMYFKGVDYRQQNNLGILQKLWLNDFDNGGSDHNIGLKIPVYMQEIGLKDINVRTNDCVNFLNPEGDSETYEKIYDSLVSGGWGAVKNKHEAINSLIARGLTAEEAEQQFDCETILHNYVRENKKTACIVGPLGQVISFGTV